MSLPQIDAPLHEMTLVSTDKKVIYRPFLVKEKKILMGAAESKDPHAAYLAIKQIVNNCTFGKVDVDDLALFDLQHLFVNIRSKSIGEIAEFKFSCPKCEAEIASQINFDEIKIQKDPKHNKKIMINETTGLMMKYPSLEIEKMLSAGVVQEEMDIKIICACIEYVFDKDGVYYAKETEPKELQDLVESLTEKQYLVVKAFFDTIPKMEHSIPYNCSKCQHSDNFEVKDFYGFFA